MQICELESGMITEIEYCGSKLSGIICRIFPSSIYVYCLGKMRIVSTDKVKIPIRMIDIEKRITLFRLYSYYLWRIGEWRHVRFVKFGKKLTGVVANDGQIWSFYNIVDIYPILGDLRSPNPPG